MTSYRDSTCQPSPDGPRLHLRSWGPAKGRPLVISHGFLEQCAAWDRVAAGLGRWVITYDQRGHGHSEHLGPDGFYHFFDYVSDLDGLLRTLGQPVDLVGHSMGGTVAVLLAALRPKAVEALVIIEGLGPPDSTHKAIRQGTLFLDHRRAPPSHTPLASVEDGVQRMRRLNVHLSDAEATRLVKRHTRIDDQNQLIWRWDPRHRMRSPRPFSARTFMHYLKAIKHRTLLVFGDQSFYMDMADRDERVACIDRAETVTLKGVGHHPHHQCPDTLITLIQNHCPG